MTTTSSEHTLEQALLIVEALVPLLIRSGVGYSEFAAACKPIFYRQALLEAHRTRQKTTDSSISLLSGLHRRDTANLRKAVEQDPSLQDPPVSQPVSIPKQVVARWLGQVGQDTIAIYGDTNSFESIVRQISKDQHPRSILTELERLGIVQIKQDDMVTLKRQAFTPDPKTQEAQEILAQNVADHIAAGLINLFADVKQNNKGVLEQAIFSDELSPASIKELNNLANKLWFDTLDKVLKRAIDLHKRDKNRKDANKRFRMGMYVYHTDDDKGV